MRYARVYTFSNTVVYGYTDYLYVEGNNSGVIPNDPDATGTWVVVASSSTSGDSGGGNAYIPYVYAHGSALGGETTIAVPNGTVGVPMIVVEGFIQTVGYGFEFDVSTSTVTLAQPLELGDEVLLLLSGSPAVPDKPNVSDWVVINWPYNYGAAVGGESLIDIPYTFQSVPAVFKNGLRLYPGLTTQSYTIDADNQRIFMTEPLVTNDRVIIQIGGEYETLTISDRTKQEIARGFNLTDAQVILDNDVVSTLNDKVVVYAIAQQKSYKLPALPTNVHIVSITGNKLIYSPGNVEVTLLPINIIS